MRTNKLVLIILVVCILCGAVIVALKSNNKVANLLGEYTKDIKKIDLVNGSTGDVIYVEDSKVINKITDYISKLNLKKVKRNASTGWSYKFHIYKSSEDFLDITFLGEEFCIIDDEKFQITDKQSGVTIKELYEKINTK